MGSSIIESKTLIKYIAILFVMIFSINSVLAVSEGDINLDKIKFVSVSFHLIELFLSVFIGYMALKFFRITKPVNVFLVIYVAIGFFIINILLHIMLYALNYIGTNISFVSVYLSSRVALIAMLISLSALFYHLNRQMRKI